MAAPKKRLGKGKNRLKFKDVSPRAEKGDQVHVKKIKDEDLIDVSPRAEENERKEVTGKKAGGALKPVPEDKKKSLGQLPTAVRNKIGFQAKGGPVKKMGMGGKCRGMGAATRGGNFVRNG